jgi:hypothetical protein
MNDNTFLIEVDRMPDYAATIAVVMEPSADVMDIARRLSLSYKGRRITVSMFARYRRVYMDGRVVSSSPDLSEFYLEPSKQDAWAWSCYGKVQD